MVTQPYYCVKGLLNVSTYAGFCRIIEPFHMPLWRQLLAWVVLRFSLFTSNPFFLHLTFEWVVGGVFLGPVSVCSSMAERVSPWRGRVSCPRKQLIWIWRIFKLDILYLRITKMHIFNLHILYLEIIKIHIFKGVDYLTSFFGITIYNLYIFHTCVSHILWYCFLRVPT